MKEQTHEDPRIAAAAERQMHTWAMMEESRDRAIRRQNESRSAPPAINYVTISREAGLGGSEIGQTLGQRLGWEVFDKNLLDQVAARFHLCRRMLDLVDETQSNWVFDVLGNWMDCQIVPHTKYVSHLSRVILSAAGRGHAVFVGRGAQYILPRQQLLSVRLVASPKYRLQRFMEQTGLNEIAARRSMAEMDAGRREFVQQFFHRDVADPHNYDLVINVERSGREGAVVEILTALEHRVARPISAACIVRENGVAKNIPPRS
jgi:hypothetical protein